MSSAVKVLSWASVATLVSACVGPSVPALEDPEAEQLLVEEALVCVDPGPGEGGAGGGESAPDGTEGAPSPEPASVDDLGEGGAGGGEACDETVDTCSAGMVGAGTGLASCTAICAGTGTWSDVCWNICANAMAMVREQGCNALFTQCTTGTFWGCTSGPAKKKATEICLMIYNTVCLGQ